MFNLKIAFGDKVGNLIRSGDQAREAKQWRSAIAYYERVVATKPSLASIWVQLGHARKEHGDLAGAETAYQTAIQLEPDSADTALHMGHLHKVARRMEDAAAWYRRSFRLDHLNINAREELTALGQLSDEGDWAADPLELTAHSQPLRRLLWDCTRHHRLASAGQFCAEEKWFVDLGIASSKHFDVTPAMFDQEAGRFLRCSFEGNVIDGREAAALPKGNGAHTDLVIGVNCRRTLPTDLIRLLCAARSQPGMRIFGVVRDAAASDPGPGSSDSLEILKILEEHATAILVCQGKDRELAEDIARRVGRRQSMVFALDPAPSSATPRAVVPRARAVKRILILESQDAHDMPMSAPRHSEASGEIISRVAWDESTHSCKAEDALKPGARITPAEAWRELASARIQTLLIPRSRPDGDIWAAHALAHGVEVLCHAGNRRVFQVIGTCVSYFDDHGSAHAEALPPVAATTDTRPSLAQASKRVEETLHTPWIQALNTIATAQEHFSPPVIPANAARYGLYYGSEEVAGTGRQYSEADGRSMLLGAGWGATTSLGTAIADGDARIQFCLPFPPEGVVTCRALLYRADASTDDATLALTWAELEAEPLTNTPRSGGATYSVHIGRTCPQDQPRNNLPRLAGFLIHPKKRDHHWHEFLDRTSRSIRSFRNLPLRLPGSLTEPASSLVEQHCELPGSLRAQDYA
ncbi:hypothetical protein [Cupriavidus sp. PET2-C1]